jgi:acyl-CoA thioester hydrolase
MSTGPVFPEVLTEQYIGRSPGIASALIAGGARVSGVGSPSLFSLPIVPRYAEIDQQGVVFNGHYLTWFDEACTAFLDDLDVTYPGLIESGHDVQVVHTDIDFAGPVRWRDAVRVEVACESIGTTSFTLGFHVRRMAAGSAPGDERVAVRGRNVYVVVSTDDWAKRPLPCALRDALTSVEQQVRNAWHSSSNAEPGPPAG